MRADVFVFDTNVLISAFLSGSSIPAMAFDKAFESYHLVRSSETLEEFVTRFLSDKFNKYIPFSRRLQLIETYTRKTLEVPISVEIDACLDPNDNKFLELAIFSNASAIISGRQRFVSNASFPKYTNRFSCRFFTAF